MCVWNYLFSLSIYIYIILMSISHLASWLRTRRFSEPTFRPSGATNHWKNIVNRDFPTFSRICIFFLLTLSLLLFSLLIFLFSLTLSISAFHLSILSEVWLLYFLRLLYILYYIRINFIYVMCVWNYLPYIYIILMYYISTVDCYVRWTFQSFCHWRCPCCPSPCRATSRTGPWLVGVGLSLVHIGLFLPSNQQQWNFIQQEVAFSKNHSNPTFTVHKLVSPKIWWLYAKHQTFVSPGASTNCRPNVRSPKNSKIWFPKWIYQWKNLKSTSANPRHVANWWLNS